MINEDSNEEGWTPLFVSAAKSTQTDLEVVKLLVEHGAEMLRPKPGDGMTPVHVAAGSNDIHLLEFLLNNVQNKKEAANLPN